MKTIFVYTVALVAAFVLLFIPQTTGSNMLLLAFPLLIGLSIFSIVARKRRGGDISGETKYLPLFSIVVAMLAFAVALGGPLIANSNGDYSRAYEYTGNQLGMGYLIKKLGFGAVMDYNTMGGNMHSMLHEVSGLCQFVCRLPFYLLLVGIICAAVVCVNPDKKGLAKVAGFTYMVASMLLIALWALFPLLTEQKIGTYMPGRGAIVAVVFCLIAQMSIQTFAKSKK